MTGYTVNTGSNKKFSTGWDQVFTKSNKKSAEKKDSKKKDVIEYVDKTKSSGPKLGR